MLSRNVNLIGQVLGEVITDSYGTEVFDLIEKLRILCREASHENNDEKLDEAAKIIAAQDLNTLRIVLRAYTAYFHLVNKSEQIEIARINRERAREATSAAPRAESIADAVRTLRERGKDASIIQHYLTRLCIQPTLTAHPTEARRRSILLHQSDIADALEQLTDPRLLPREIDSVLAKLRNSITLLLATNEVRARSMTVEDEVRNGLYFLATSIWETVPKIHADVREALQTYCSDIVIPEELPVFLRYHSWIGGDRDGNPRVTAAVTRWTLAEHRRDVLKLHIRSLHRLRLRLSVSDAQIQIPQVLITRAMELAGIVELSDRIRQQVTGEPYRLLIYAMGAAIDNLLKSEEIADQRIAYDSKTYLTDLRLIRDSLRAGGLGDVAQDDLLSSMIIQARTFGFHMAALDIRQHSREHEAAAAELLCLAGMEDSYSRLDEDARVDVLSRALQTPTPLRPSGGTLSSSTQELMDTLGVVRDAISQDSESIGSYIISMTNSVSDVLEVLVLLKEAGLWRMENGTVWASIDVVPLFETIADLDDSQNRLTALFSNPIYRNHLIARARNGAPFQEVMLGYSDSNKDGGYWMANWALHKAQRAIAHTAKQYGIDVQVFHGRGGTIGRGGGRANQAILAMPPELHTGRIRFTEQGEVISFRYALPAIAQRHLEQIVNAQLIALADTDDIRASISTNEEESYLLMQGIADRSMASYLDLISDSDFWTFYITATPVAHIAGLPLASRPVSRKGAGELDFESLRAIPWVFAWTQTRYTIPGWYGIGAGLQHVLSVKGDHKNLDLLRGMWRSWTFFRTVVADAQREMERARLSISRRYSDMAARQRVPVTLYSKIVAEYDQAKSALLYISGQESLLENDPVIARSIALRNPYTDVLNLVQVELLWRWYSLSESERQTDEGDVLRQAIYISINGIAAAMQSTG